MSNCLDCPVYFRGLSAPGADAGPTVLARTDQEFIQAVLDEVSAADGLTTLGKSVAKVQPGESVLKLFQPVHRTFNRDGRSRPSARGCIVFSVLKHNMWGLPIKNPDAALFQ